MTEPELMAIVAALFSMMNPIGNVGIFAGLTEDYSTAEARTVAIRSAIASAITLLVVVWTGGLLLKFFGIDVNELRAAGGIIVLIIGLHMLFNKAEHKTSHAETEDAKDRASIAIVPIAIPIVAGPGTMATALVGAERYPDIMARIEISIVILLLATLIGVLFAFAKPVAAKLGQSGMAVVTRIMGMVLVALSMGMLTSGIAALIPALSK